MQKALLSRNFRKPSPEIRFELYPMVKFPVIPGYVLQRHKVGNIGSIVS